MVQPVPIKAAQYVRMSTDKQVYSTANQQAAIASYALLNGFEIVRTYADEGRSGLHLKGRDALQEMLRDVLSGDAAFKVVLVYDVSRWGRFQDIDESAHYEFLCRRAGVPVHYCAEPFQNDGSPTAAIMKALRRVMAGEYSRDLSEKVFAGCARLAAQGYRMGARAPYGLRRQMLDDRGVPRGMLMPGEQKHLRTDRVVLVPGPSAEVATVRRIFNMCAYGGFSTRQIARTLNNEGVKGPAGGNWTGISVAGMLRSEVYKGDLIYARSSKKLGGKELPNDPSKWIRAIGAVIPLVDPRTFHMAREQAAARKWSLSDEALLHRLRTLLAKHGKLSVRHLLAEPGFPMPTTLARRFGSFRHACELAGYSRLTVPYTSMNSENIARALSLLGEAKAAITAAGGRLTPGPIEHTIQVDGRFVLGVTACLPRPQTKSASWRVHLRRKDVINVMLVGLLRSRGQPPREFALLPASRFERGETAYVSDYRSLPLTPRLNDLAALYPLLRGADLFQSD